MQLPASSNSGGGVHTQLLAEQMMSAPWAARIRGTSGNQISQQMSRPIRPMRVSNTGYSLPAVKISFSRCHRCVLR